MERTGHQVLNLDLLSLAIARQVAVERNDRANQNLLAMLNGDAWTWVWLRSLRSVR